MCLEKRGPDFQDIHLEEWVALGHRRLSIIDTSAAGNQPMWDESKRYCIIYNGEIFNYKELRKTLEAKGIAFFSDSDTEVLLKLYINDGPAALSKPTASLLSASTIVKNKRCSLHAIVTE